MKLRVIIFAKAPLAGQVKTRLIPALGEQKATTLARNMLIYTIDKALQSGADTVELCTTELDNPIWLDIWPNSAVPDKLTLTEQISGDLGCKMADAAKRAMTDGEIPLLIGTDCPALDTLHLQGAINALATHDLVITPVRDGGYALLGMREFYEELFTHMPWSTAAVNAITLARVKKYGLTVAQMPTLIDIDTANDLNASLLSTFL